MKSVSIIKKDFRVFETFNMRIKEIIKTIIIIFLGIKILFLCNVKIKSELFINHKNDSLLTVLKSQYIYLNDLNREIIKLKKDNSYLRLKVYGKSSFKLPN
jgi:hypothetical protein